MRKILRYLMGSKEASPSTERRFASAHELAIKAVLRRRGDDERKGETDGTTTVELPVVAERLLSPDQQATGVDTSGGVVLRSKTERRAERRQRRRQGNPVAKHETSAGEQQTDSHEGGTSQLRSKSERQAERRQRRRQRNLLSEPAASVGDGAVDSGR